MFIYNVFLFQIYSVYAVKSYINDGYSLCYQDYFGLLIGNIEPLTSYEKNDTDLYAIDYPGMDNTGKTVAFGIQFGSQNDYLHNEYFNRYYLYYKTSINGVNSGLTIEYCQIIKPNDINGLTKALIYSWLLDVNGNTITLDDSEFNIVGGTFRINPFNEALIDVNEELYEVVNPGIADDLFFLIRLNSLGDWSSCSNNICSDTSGLKINIDAQSRTESQQAILRINDHISCQYGNMTSKTITYNDPRISQIRVIKMVDAEGVGGRGVSTFKLCPKNTHVQAYVYDIRPDNFGVNPTDPGIGARMVCVIY